MNTIQTGIRVIGTAGHVDHGKSSLIEALTGVNPDRLKEEQARQMTIDLGFGWLTLPDGLELGIVDVPGHRDFVENMLAGVAALDAVLLVVAADEGVMPQTIEHLAIIDLLRIPTGVIALTKTDLVTDSASLEAIEAGVRSAVRGTVLQDAPIVRVSARTANGLPELVTALAAILGQLPKRPDLGRPRLPIDRAFSMEGFGTVVTGTLVDGQLAVGDEVRILPLDRQGRIRGLQTHRRQTDRAFPGSRTAVNLSGIQAGELRRGQVVTRPGQYEITRRVDAQFRALRGVATHIVHNTVVKAFIGTSENIATLRLLGGDEIQAGEQGWIQLEFREPVICARGDAFILRRPSPPETLGGGLVVDMRPTRRHRRNDAAIITSLEALATGKAADVVLEAALSAGPSPRAELIRLSGMEEAAAEAALEDLLRSGKLISLGSVEGSGVGDPTIVSGRDYEAVSAKMDRIVATHHARLPLRRGIRKEELKSQLGLTATAFNGILARWIEEGRLVANGTSLAAPSHDIHFSSLQQSKIDALLQLFDASPHAPPTVKECQQAVGDDVLGALRELGNLVQVSDEVIFRKQDYDEMVGAIREAIGTRGQISLAEVRDMFQTSRRYTQALLEHLDSLGVTRRRGDFRVLAVDPASTASRKG